MHKARTKAGSGKGKMYPVLTPIFENTSTSKYKTVIILNHLTFCVNNCIKWKLKLGNYHMDKYMYALFVLFTSLLFIFTCSIIWVFIACLTCGAMCTKWNFLKQRKMNSKGSTLLGVLFVFSSVLDAGLCASQPVWTH